MESPAKALPKASAAIPKGVGSLMPTASQTPAINNRSVKVPLIVRSPEPYPISAPRTLKVRTAAKGCAILVEVESRRPASAPATAQTRTPGRR